MTAEMGKNVHLELSRAGKGLDAVKDLERTKKV